MRLVPPNSRIWWPLAYPALHSGECYFLPLFFSCFFFISIYILCIAKCLRLRFPSRTKKVSFFCQKAEELTFGFLHLNLNRKFRRADFLSFSLFSLFLSFLMGVCEEIGSTLNCHSSLCSCRRRCCCCIPHPKILFLFVYP